MTEGRRRWPMRWLGDDEFWKGIAVQTIGTLVAALIITVVAVIVGQQEFDDRVRYYALFIVIYAVFALVLTAVILIGIFALIDDEVKKELKHPWAFRTITFIALIFAVYGYKGFWEWLSLALEQFTGYIP